MISWYMVRNLGAYQTIYSSLIFFLVLYYFPNFSMTIMWALFVDEAHVNSCVSIFDVFAHTHTHTPQVKVSLFRHLHWTTYVEFFVCQFFQIDLYCRYVSVLKAHDHMCFCCRNDFGKKITQQFSIAVIADRFDWYTLFFDRQ